MKPRFFTWVGIAVIILFVAICAVELFQQRTAGFKWIRANFGNAGLIVLNILIVIAFLALLPYRRYTNEHLEIKGAFIAFVIALMTEIFGWRAARKRL